MKNRKKSWALMGVVVACGLVLAACDDGGASLAAADQDQISDEGPTIAPAPAPAVPQELLDRLATLEDEIAAKAATTADKDAAVAALEAEIEKLKKDLKAEKGLKKKFEQAKKEAQEARKDLDAANAEIAQPTDEADQAAQEVTVQTADTAPPPGQAVAEAPMGDELLKNAKISVAFTTISDVGDTPALKSKKLKSVDDWLCVVLFKDAQEQSQVTEECEGGDCYDKVMNGIVKGADARACYHVEGCWDEDNDGVGGDGIQDDISNCTAKRDLVVKNPEATKLSDINHAYILAHDEGGNDFNFTIDWIDISTANAEAQLDGVDNASVAENFLFIFVDNVDWTKK